jgi:hypothetical protein
MSEKYPLKNSTVLYVVDVVMFHVV